MSQKTQALRQCIRDARNEQMRRARNGKYYAAGSDISEWARGKWLESVRDHVREARELNRSLLKM
jgi:hypothetical protein